MRIILRTHPDRSEPDVTFNEREVVVSDEAYEFYQIPPQVFPFLRSANNIQTRLQDMEGGSEGNDMSSEWWRALYHKTWSEVRIFFSEEPERDESLDISFHLDHRGERASQQRELYASFTLWHRVGHGSARIYDVQLSALAPNFVYPAVHELVSKLRTLCQNVKDYIPDMSEGKILECLSLLVSSLQIQISEISVPVFLEASQNFAEEAGKRA